MSLQLSDKICYIFVFKYVACSRQIIANISYTMSRCHVTIFRCVGRGVTSKIYCMKAGLQGFYGGPLEPGSSEYTFVVPTPGPCLDKTINPFIGIR